MARAEEGALPQDSCSLGTVAPFQWRGVEASQKQEQKGVCLLRLLAFLETHVEGICWECSILGLGLVFLDAPLRRKSWGRGGDVREARYALRPQRPKPQSPLTSHPSPCQPLDSFPGALTLPVQTLPQVFPPALLTLGLLSPAYPPGLGRTTALNIYYVPVMMLDPHSVPMRDS